MRSPRLGLTGWLAAAGLLTAGVAAPTPASAAPPSAPVNLEAQTVSTTQIDLSWTNTGSDPTRVVIEEFDGSVWKTVRTTKLGLQRTRFSGLAPGSLHRYRVAAKNKAGQLSTFTGAVGAVTDKVVAPGTCSPSQDVCLAGHRFKVETLWRTSNSDTGPGDGEVVRPDTALLWNFSSENIDVIIKVLNACDLNGHYWVFASGLTAVEMRVTVTDTEKGRQRTYFNPLGRALGPVFDTSAFATCP